MLALVVLGLGMHSSFVAVSTGAGVLTMLRRASVVAVRIRFVLSRVLLATEGQLPFVTITA